MKKIILCITLIPILFACGNQPPSENAVQTAIAQTQMAMPTATITPSPTPVTYSEPASQYLPTKSDIPSGYDLTADAKVIEQLNKSGAAVSYTTNRNRPLQGAHDGSPTSFIYFVSVAENKDKALTAIQELTKPSNNEALFSAIAPVAVEPIGNPIPLDVKVENCHDLLVYKTNGALFTPTVYIAAICRIENVVSIYWSRAIDNYDGQGQRIPDEVLIQQTNIFVSILAQTIK